MTVGEVEHQRNDAVMPHVDRSRIAGGRQGDQQIDKETKETKRQRYTKFIGDLAGALFILC